MTDIKFTMVKEGSLPPLSDREYWDGVAEACERLGLNNSLVVGVLIAEVAAPEASFPNCDDMLDWLNA